MITNIIEAIEANPTRWALIVPLWAITNIVGVAHCTETKPNIVDTIIEEVYDGNKSEYTSFNTDVYLIEDKPSEANIATTTSVLTNYLSSKVGLPYHWGGRGEENNKFDCSSLAQSAFKEVDIAIPRTAQQQYNSLGKSVSLFNMKKGDLLFWDTAKYAKVTHVSVYIGDGKMIHARSRKHGIVKTDVFIPKSKLTSVNLVGVKRII